MEIIQARMRERARHSLGSFRLQRREVTEPHDGFLRQHPASAIAGLRDPWWAGRIPGYGAAHPPPSSPLSGLHNGGVSNVYVGGGGVDGRPASGEPRVWAFVQGARRGNHGSGTQQLSTGTATAWLTATRRRRRRRLHPALAHRAGGSDLWLGARAVKLEIGAAQSPGGIGRPGLRPRLTLPPWAWGVAGDPSKDHGPVPRYCKMRASATEALCVGELRDRDLGTSASPRVEHRTWSKFMWYIHPRH